MNEYISYEQVAEGAEQLRSCAQQMEQIFESVTNNMNNMTSDSTWKGVAAGATATAFASKKAKFSEYVNQVNKFADAFTQAKEALQTSEEQMKREASNL